MWVPTLLWFLPFKGLYHFVVGLMVMIVSVQAKALDLPKVDITLSLNN
jgi:hypothetical protein